MEVRQTSTFSDWLGAIKDERTRSVIRSRIDRLADGNFGDVSPVGEGVSELRIHFGPGFRIYCVRRGQALVILLCGGDKASQVRDIAQAKRMATEV